MINKWLGGSAPSSKGKKNRPPYQPRGVGAAAPLGVNFYLGTGREAECRAVEVVVNIGNWPWVGLVGLQGLAACRQTLQTGQDSEARRAGEKWMGGDRRAVAAEAGGAERNRLEQPEAGGFLPAAGR